MVVRNAQGIPLTVICILPVVIREQHQHGNRGSTAVDEGFSIAKVYS